MYYMDIEGKKEKVNLFYNILKETKIKSIDKNEKELKKFLNRRIKIYIINSKTRGKIVELKFFLTLNSSSNNGKKYVFHIRKKIKSEKDIEEMKKMKEELIEYIVNKIKVSQTN